jgi:SAM-dependent methyltransferase
VSFDVAAESYDRFMGRYSTLLAPRLADLADVEIGQRVIDVGCGPGALTGELVRRVGAERVAAVDPSPPFVKAATSRFPGVDVRQATAEHLPFHDDAFDVALAQLVVHFMADPVAGIAEMARVVRPGGTVAACVWDFGSARDPLSAFWAAAHEIDPDISDESHLAGVREGHLVELFEAAGLAAVRSAELVVSVEHASFEAWWEPFTLGVGPGGAFVQRLDPGRRDDLRDACRARLSDGPFTITARAWAARGSA